MRYNDKSVVTAQNVCVKLGYKDAHSIHSLARRFGIEHWKLTGKELARFKVDNGLVSSVRWLVVFPADAFDGLSRTASVKYPELKEEEPVKNTRMSQELMALSFENKEFGELRAMTISGDPWFVGLDVARSLGYQNAGKAVIVHVDDEDKQKKKLHSRNGNAGQIRELTVINESGMYSLILSSKLPSAKKFKHWVTKEVLPSIRKTGGYGADSIERKVDALARSMSALWLYLSTRDAMAAGFSKEIANRELR